MATARSLLFRGRRRLRPAAARGFTLVELLVSMVILLIILVVGFDALHRTSNIWRRSVAQVQAFQAARQGFDLLTRDLAQATLNPYLEYVDGAASPGPYFASESAYNNQPVRYARKSDLHFVCALPGTALGADMVPGTRGTGTGVFFQAPLGHTAPVLDPSTGNVATDEYNGLTTLLNPVGYYVEFGQDAVPLHVAAQPGNSRARYRLKQLLIPSERDTVFATSTPGNLAYDPASPARWFTGLNLNSAAGTAKGNVNAVADNVLALLVRVQDPAVTPAPAAPYDYDSHASERINPQPITANQIPPVINVTMVALDEASTQRLENGAAEPAVLRDLLAATVNGQPMFTRLANYPADLAALEKGLATARVNYRVFATSVPIRESKWTK